jgi:hypothetical protein
MTLKDLSTEQLKQAIKMVIYSQETPLKALDHLKICAEIGRLYNSSMRLRKLRTNSINESIKFNYEQFNSKINHK